ncbi:hypothetical protein HPP92_026413 [Vanilla planifolia]|uniref:Uncharacterized protein n=1 Tax=Vanilla planifolia TaxID=51239 RepID=A0A835PHD8_VANPL|nr:hypothetical protein HPP92_026413 [Vanilla planifolia]
MLFLLPNCFQKEEGDSILRNHAAKYAPTDPGGRHLPLWGRGRRRLLPKVHVLALRHPMHLPEPAAAPAGVLPLTAAAPDAGVLPPVSAAADTISSSTRLAADTFPALLPSAAAAADALQSVLLTFQRGDALLRSHAAGTALSSGPCVPAVGSPPEQGREQISHKDHGQGNAEPDAGDSDSLTGGDDTPGTFSRGVDAASSSDFMHSIPTAQPT